MKAVARLALGWLLMLAGAVLMLEGGAPIRPQSGVFTAVEMTTGFLLMVAGVWLRRRAGSGS